MKKLIAMLVLISLAGSPSICPAASTVNVNVTAIIPEQLELGSWIRYAPPDGDPWGSGSGDVTSLDFGTLIFDDTYHIWKATKYFTVFLMAATSGSPYRIQQTNSDFIMGSTNLNSSLIMTPDYKAEDKIAGVAQGSIPSGDSYGTESLARL